MNFVGPSFCEKQSLAPGRPDALVVRLLPQNAAPSLVYVRVLRRPPSDTQRVNFQPAHHPQSNSTQQSLRPDVKAIHSLTRSKPATGRSRA